MTNLNKNKIEKILYSNFFKITSSFLISFKIISLFVFSLIPSVAYQAAITKNDLFYLHNEERIKENLEPLKYSKKLEKTATAKAKDMAQKGYFDHNSPDGTSWKEWFENGEYDYIYAGENLAVNFNSNISILDGWMNSASHKKNILNKNFTEMGVGTFYGNFNNNKTTFVVVHFGKPISVTNTNLNTNELNSSDSNFGFLKINWDSFFKKFDIITTKGLINTIYLIICSFLFGIFSFNFYDTIKKKDPFNWDLFKKTVGLSVFFLFTIILF